MLKDFRRCLLSDDTGAVSSAVFRGEDSEVLMVVNAGAAPVNRPGRLWRLPPVSRRNAAFPDLKIRWRTELPIAPCEYLPETGEYRSLPAVRRGGCWEFSGSLERLQTRLFVIDPVHRLPTASPERVVPNVIPLPDSLEYRLTADNVLLLDHFDCRATHSEDDYVLEIDRKIREELGLPARNGSDVQPWAAPETTGGPSRKIVLETAFELKTPSAISLKLALEAPAEYTIRLNGEPVKSSPRGWFVDPAIRMIHLPREFLAPGRNELTLETEYRAGHPGLEAMYLLGSFAVDRAGKTITPLPECLNSGDLTDQGLPFYSDSIEFPLTVRRPDERPLQLALPRFRGALVRVKIGGKTVSVHWMQPCVIDLSGIVAPGRTETVTLELVGSRRNLFGPFYTGRAESGSAPLYFHQYNTPERRLVPFGWNADENV